MAGVEIFHKVALRGVKMTSDFLILQLGFAVDFFRFLDFQDVAEVGHVPPVEMARTVPRESSNHLNMISGKRGHLVEIVGGGNAPHAVMCDFSCASRIEDVSRATPPSGEIVRPDVMMSLLDFKIFRQHSRRLNSALDNALAASFGKTEQSFNRQRAYAGHCRKLAENVHRKSNASADVGSVAIDLHERLEEHANQIPGLSFDVSLRGV